MIPIRPATDSALADAMAYVIIKEGLQDQEFLDKCCLGFDAAHMPEGADPSLNCLSYLRAKQTVFQRHLNGVKRSPVSQLTPSVSWRSAMPPQNRLPLSRDMAPREMHMGSKVPVALSFLPVLQEM